METTTPQFVDFRFEIEIQKEIAERMNQFFSDNSANINLNYIYDNGESN